MNIFHYMAVVSITFSFLSVAMVYQNVALSIGSMLIGWMMIVVMIIAHVAQSENQQFDESIQRIENQLEPQQTVENVDDDLSVFLSEPAEFSEMIDAELIELVSGSKDTPVTQRLFDPDK